MATSSRRRRCFPGAPSSATSALPLEIMGISSAEQKERIKRTLDLVNLTGFEKKYPWQLSGGMQQRASIARALAFDADLLLMDEPFGALDEIVRDHLNQQLLELWARTNKTICFVTHSIPEAVYLSTRIVVMSPRPGRVTDVIEVDAAEGAAARHPRDAGIPRHRARACATACAPGTAMRIEARRWTGPATNRSGAHHPRGAGRRLVRRRGHPQRAVPARSRPPRRRDARTIEFVGKTLSQPKPTLPAPHQVAHRTSSRTPSS